MSKPDIPSFADGEQDEDEATLMWDREGIDLPDLASLGGELEHEASSARVSSRLQAAASGAHDKPAAGGLDEGELFGDVMEASAQRSSAAMPVEGELVSLFQQSHDPGAVRTVEMASAPAVLQAARRQRAKRLYWLLGTLALVSAAAAVAYLYGP